jgi:hypothetical protein
MTEIQTVPVIAAMPTRKNPLGRVEEGHYRVADGVVTLVTAQGIQRTDSRGKPIQHKLAPGETARAVAHRLTKRHLPPRRSDFNRAIHYPKRGVA